jgi:hypothetical protein
MSTSTPNARGRRSPFGAATPSEDTTLTGVSTISFLLESLNTTDITNCLQLQRLPSHTRYPLTPSRLITATTPGTQRSASRYTPRARGVGAPSTPYGLRARQQRAANTPGRDRRRSGRMQRETTFDILRNLGKGKSFIAYRSTQGYVLISSPGISPCSCIKTYPVLASGAERAHSGAS